MNCETSFQRSCLVFEASSTDVASAFRDLSGDMDPDFVHVFLDKLQRYAKKPDRALFLVRYRGSIIAFATIIEQAPVPGEVECARAGKLNSYACGTGLMVLPEFRKKGVASLLVQEWEAWSQKRGLPGIWVVTRKMARWYQDHFHYSQFAYISRRGVKKTVLEKQFLAITE